MHWLSVISANVAVSHILLKLDSFDYIFVADSMGLSSVTLTWPKANKFDRRTQSNGHYAIQDHLRSPILVSIERPYGLTISL